MSNIIGHGPGGCPGGVRPPTNPAPCRRCGKMVEQTAPCECGWREHEAVSTGLLCWCVYEPAKKKWAARRR